MRNLIFFAAILICSSTLEAQTPLIADAGKDSVFCTIIDLNLQVGGELPAQGGTPPYSYYWATSPSPYIFYAFPEDLEFYCDHFLSDCSLANPELLSVPSDSSGITFILTVTDSLGQVAIDSVK